MGYEMGIGERRLYIDDDGVVYESPHKNMRLADSIEAFNGNPPKAFKEPEVKEEPKEEEVGLPTTCEICGFKAQNEHGLNVHKKRKHKVY